eukprot:2236102-Rhodomonas_salina.1
MRSAQGPGDLTAAPGHAARHSAAMHGTAHRTSRARHLLLKVRERACDCLLVVKRHRLLLPTAALHVSMHVPERTQTHRD